MRLVRIAMATALLAVALNGRAPDASAAEAPPPRWVTLEVRGTALGAGGSLRGKAVAVDETGDPAPVTWDFGDGAPTVGGDSVQHRYATPGLFTLSVSAEGGGGSTATQTFPVVVRPSGASRRPAAALSAKSAIPYEYVGIFGAFEPGVPTVVEFRFGKVAVLVTPTLVSASQVRVAAPPLLRNAAFVGGAATVQVIQGTGADAAFTYAGRLRVARLPRVVLPAGELTRSFTRLARGVLADARDRISGTELDTPEHADSIARMRDFLDGIDVSVAFATGDGLQGAKAAIPPPGEYQVELSGATVRQLDAQVAGLIAAGARNSTDPSISLAYRTWEEATRLDRRQPFDADRLAALVAAEENWRSQVKQGTDALTDGISTMMAPLTVTTATAGLTGLATGNPIILLNAARLSLCADVLNAGLILGLGLDAAHAYLTDDQLQYEVYLGTAVNLTGDFLLGKALGAVVGAAAGEAGAELFGHVRDLAGTFGVQFLSFQSLTQPPVPADASLSVGDASGSEGGSDLEFEITLTPAVSRKVSVQLSTADGTATAGRDYARVSGTTVTFAPGETKRTVTVRVLDDTAKEPTETVFAWLSRAAGAPISRAQGVGTIVDDDVSHLSADTGAGDTLGVASGCGYTTSLSVDGNIRFDVELGGAGGTAECTISGYAYSPDYGSNSYPWQGTLTWSGDTLSGTAARTDNAARPAATVSITRLPNGQYSLTATLPFTYFIFELDGSCTGPLQTFNHQTTGVLMQAE